MTEKAVAPLHEEHRALMAHVEALSAAADAVAALDADAVRTTVAQQVGFLRGHLLPHAEAEDRALYPLVEEVMEAPGATATMRRDHVEVRRLVDELTALGEQLERRTPTAADRRLLQRLLDGLHAVLRLHFAKEEEIYLPALAAGLSPARTAHVIEQMHRSASAQVAR